MRRRVCRIAPLLVLPLILAPVAAAGEPSRRLWATVNRCDTATSPNTVGIRARMPGTGTRRRLYMRFEVQFYSATRQRFVPTGSSSRWIKVGDGRRSVQSGYSFQFADPPEGGQFVMRGIVQFRYSARRKRKGRRARWVVVKRFERRTRGGYPGVAGGDPFGSSFSLCIIRRGIGEGRL